MNRILSILIALAALLVRPGLPLAAAQSVASNVSAFTTTYSALGATQTKYTEAKNIAGYRQVFFLINVTAITAGTVTVTIQESITGSATATDWVDHASFTGATATGFARKDPTATLLPYVRMKIVTDGSGSGIALTCYTVYVDAILDNARIGG